MSGGKRNFVLGISLILVCILLLGCLPNKQGGFSCIAAPLISKIQSMLPTAKKAGQPTGASQSAATDTGPTRPHPPVRTGDITTGPKVQVASQSIDSSGGTIAVSKTSDPLDGFAINVPPKSYADSRTFKVSSAPITNQTFGSDIIPVSPMISVDNGGGYCDELMYVRVPVKVPEGNFAMGFLYDEKTGQLEGMPLLAVDADSVTVATRHFSNFFISMIAKALLKKDIDSGFRPGIDDWQFTNYGSFIATDGHCEGQSLTAMWYYCTQPDGKDMCLYGRYDNNGNKPATPDLWQDDSLGYRLCSVVQQDYKENFADNFWFHLSGKAFVLKNNKWELVDVPGLDDETRYYMFASSILATHEPQFVRIRREGGAHTMVVYKIIGNALYVADPNYPGNFDRKIIYYSGEGKFKPYESGANKKEIEKGNSNSYDNIEYYAKSTLLRWDKIPQRWSELKNKTVGNDKFFAYKIKYTDDKGQWQELGDGYVSSVKLISITSSRGDLTAYRDGKALKKDADGNIELNTGNNNLGMLITGRSNNIDFTYVDFKYINVVYNGLSIDPTSLAGESNKEYTFTAKVDNPPDKAKYQWSVNGKQVQNSASNSLKKKFTDAGSYNIAVSLLDGSEKEIDSAKALVDITGDCPAGETPARLRNTKYIYVFFQFKNTLKAADSYDVQQVGCRSVPITWNGRCFSGKYNGQTQMIDGKGSANYILSGSVSADGQKIEDLKFDGTDIWLTGDQTRATFKTVCEIINIPYSRDRINSNSYQKDDPACKYKFYIFECTASNNLVSCDLSKMVKSIQHSGIGPFQYGGAEDIIVHFKEGSCMYDTN